MFRRKTIKCPTKLLLADGRLADFWYGGDRRADF
jgi:hypothetical protein